MSANLRQQAAEEMEKLKAGEFNLLSNIIFIQLPPPFLLDNPYFDKYASKIAKLQQQAPEEFLAKLEQQREEERKKAAKQKQQEKERSYSELMNPKKPVEAKPSELPYKKLEDVMKLELVKDKTAEEIKAIWIAYHTKKDVIAATIPTEIFDTLMANSKKYPVFIFPIPRSQGFEFIMLQFAANTIHFTPLLCYQVHKENAPECLNIVHYTEFRDKGVVLMRGELDTNILTAQEAQCLANQLQLYYTQNNPTKLQLLETFTKKPEEFSHMDVIKELENLQI